MEYNFFFFLNVLFSTWFLLIIGLNQVLFIVEIMSMYIFVEGMNYCA